MYPCNNRKELDRREGQVIREIGTINKCIAGRTKKEYREHNKEHKSQKAKEWYGDNKEKVLQKHKEWCENNKDKIKKQQSEKVCCDICGNFSTKSNLKRHQQTKKCMEALNITTSNI